MTVSVASTELDTLSSEQQQTHATTMRGWAVVEIRDDGTLGRTEVVSAATPPSAADLAQSTAERAANPPHIEADLKARWGQVQAAGGHLHEAHRTLEIAVSLSANASQLEDCLGQLALVEAFQGRLVRASTRSEAVLGTTSPRSVGSAHAHLAKAWIHLERAEFAESSRSLEQVEDMPHHHRSPWVEATRVLAEARLLTAMRRPDAAIGVLADGVDTSEIAPGPGWISGVLDATRADALLASGEPRRALAAVTPLPAPAVVEASVAAAAARHEIGDVRGASAVLAAVVGALERSPLAWRIRAWVLESHLAEDAGDHRRSWTLIDRALRSAAAEQLRTPLHEEWRWLRAFLDREPHLMHRHRAFIVGLDAMAGSRASHASTVASGPLTYRECEVLELLAQMYSTEEIARTLYVSANTVKTHVKGIFGKLGVNRRADAVRKGRALGLC